MRNQEGEERIELAERGEGERKTHTPNFSLQYSTQ